VLPLLLKRKGTRRRRLLLVYMYGVIPLLLVVVRLVVVVVLLLLLLVLLLLPSTPSGLGLLLRLRKLSLQPSQLLAVMSPLLGRRGGAVYVMWFV